MKKLQDGKWLRVLTASCVALASSATSAAESSEAAPPDCQDYKTRTSLFVDFEHCEHAASKHGSAAGEAAQKSLFIAKLSALPTAQAALKTRAKLVLAAGDGEEVAFYSLTEPSWAKRPPPHQSLGGGGYKGALISVCLTGKVVKGHYELTKGALESIQVRGSGVDFVAGASREADEREWDNPAAHAQTGTAANDVLKPLDVEAAKNAFAAYFRQNLTRLRSACNADNASEAGYVLGYLLHAIQDLSTHGGITNTEHSYLALKNLNPDADSTRIARAGTWSLKALVALKPKLKAGCLARIAALPANQAEPASAATFYGPVDGTLAALWAYRNLGPKLDRAGAPVSAKVSWFDATTADAFFDARVLAPIKALR